MTLPNELKVFLTKEIGICSCVNALPLGTPPSSPVKTCVVLLSVTEHLSPDYQLPVDMSPHLGGDPSFDDCPGVNSCPSSPV